MIVLALAASALAHALHWEGTGKVFAGDKVIDIAMRTSIARDGSVVSDSWPIAQGEAKGLRRMIIGTGSAWIERGGKREPMPGEMQVEERMQYGFYRQLQTAASWCARHPARRGPTIVSGLTETSFTCRHGQVAAATNHLAPGSEGSAVIDQRLTFVGWWHRRGMVFPRHMQLTRFGKPYFTMNVARFDAR